MMLRATTWQTVGPFFEIGLAWLYRDDLAGASVAGERIEITGRVFDADGNTVPDAVLELWQANSHGKYAHPEDEQNKQLDAGFSGFGRIATDERGRFRFTTIKPGRVPAPDASSKSTATWAPLQAPHINVSVCTRGLLRRLVTRIYFPDEAANAADFALLQVDPSRRSTLIAKRSAESSSAFEWNIVLQGSNETVFFDI
ncbi:MAG: protocatechuate 3,4-dioxygenase subunit alpha [Acidobacteria bacterium]|nr:protocatechuate 3,4-dioxygenase subunit alpha [Acidobacteriota bacterium]